MLTPELDMKENRREVRKSRVGLNINAEGEEKEVRKVKPK